MSIAGVKIALDEETIEKIFHLTKGHPFFIHFIMKHLVSEIKKGEVDYLCKIGKHLVPVEVKWQNEVNESDALHMRKFGKGFLITKDKFAVFGEVIAVPAFVFLTLTGKTIAKRRVL